MGVVIAPMHELIEDYAHSTHKLCMNCRGAHKPRFSYLQEIVFQEADPNRVRDFFRVCPFCDVAVENR